MFVLADTTGANEELVTLAYKTKNGKLDWSAQYDGPGKGNDDPGDLAVLPDGSAVVITGGEAPDGSQLQDIVTIELRHVERRPSVGERVRRGFPRG